MPGESITGPALPTLANSRRLDSVVTQYRDWPSGSTACPDMKGYRFLSCILIGALLIHKTLVLLNRTNETFAFHIAGSFDQAAWVTTELLAQ